MIELNMPLNTYFETETVDKRLCMCKRCLWHAECPDSIAVQQVAENRKLSCIITECRKFKRI